MNGRLSVTGGCSVGTSDPVENHAGIRDVELACRNLTIPSCSAILPCCHIQTGGAASFIYVERSTGFTLSALSNKPRPRRMPRVGLLCWVFWRCSLGFVELRSRQIKVRCADKASVVPSAKGISTPTRRRLASIQNRRRELSRTISRIAWAS